MTTRWFRRLKFTVNTTQRNELVDITSYIREGAKKHEIRDGFVIVYVPHTTAGVCINENADPDVKHDVLKKLDALVPKAETYYKHGEGNSDSHVKSILTGNSVTVLIEGLQPLLGQWQGIYLAEFDGPRTREVWLKFVETQPAPQYS